MPSSNHIPLSCHGLCNHLLIVCLIELNIKNRIIFLILVFYGTHDFEWEWTLCLSELNIILLKLLREIWFRTSDNQGLHYHTSLSTLIFFYPRNIFYYKKYIVTLRVRNPPNMTYMSWEFRYMSYKLSKFSWGLSHCSWSEFRILAPRIRCIIF
jgi:hypothetical protein